jgi:hypothetical protein
MAHPPRIRYHAAMTENPATPPPPPAPQKGIPALAWVGIGCGGILIVAIIAVSRLVGWCKRTVGDISEFQKNPEKAAAELMVRMNPDLEKISQDDTKGEMTIRTKDGREMTMRYKDIAEGKFTVTDGEGNVAEFGGSDLSQVPAWVPRVPDMKIVTSAFKNQQDGKTSGLYTATSSQSADQLGEFFAAEARKLGASSSSTSTTSVNGVENRILTFEGGGRTLNIVITTKPGDDTQVSVGYEEG